MPLTSRKVVIIGASSYVGARLQADLRDAGLNIIGTAHRNLRTPDEVALDLRDRSAVERFIKENQPETIVLAAAYASQKAVEQDPLDARRVNIEGVESLVAAANHVGAKLIYLSSEAVFHGSQYGELKREAEASVARTTAGFLNLRLGMCFGASPNTTNDRPHNRLLKAAINKGAVSFDSNLEFYPTFLSHLSVVLLQLLQREHWNETMDVVCMPETNRYAIAKAVLEPLNIEVTPTILPEVPPLPPLSDRRLQELELPTLTTSTMIQRLKEELHEQLRQSR